ncbi:hypothetical protein ISF_00737 [Cordyceps fumosorosea ARSEF 2679]|uniref:BTB domain-containing protein n=1 Tax=Cordyceps fumosorosea (strain ARSEF 2679) TaxID=1081104 RepID=A0A168EI45_CORFA|nr:hypothetical protein ISF_00737 [Cordyceps fumosorosea ARSEF 2679]OAA73836.1 hypothetical protein ISF_00737 [Cordyceps fumosorosea ARSEF 2679]
MQSETVVLQTTYLAGKKKGKPLPARAATVMGTRLSTANNNGSGTSRSGSVRYRHQHSNSTPPTGIHHHHRAASSVSSSHRQAAAAAPPPTRPPPAAPPAPRPRSHSTSAIGETTTVLVGRQRARFVISRRLLCAASPFFRTRLLVTSTNTALWLPGESATMFELFVEWLHAPRSFRSHLDDAITADNDNAAEAELLHWALVRLHLFAARLGLPPLQDLAMDAVQDLYLRRDWDVAPAVVAYLYVRCEARHAGRLRRWAVAMVAFSLAAAGQEEEEEQQQQPNQQRASSATHLRKLLAALPELAADYAAHVRGMRAAGLDLRFKNPQLRIPANALRSDKRAFGFRECSFHSHRAEVGQGACPHSASGLRAADTGSVLDLLGGGGDEQAVAEDEDEDEDEEVDETRQWEKEWAGEFEGWEDEPEYTYATTSLRRPPSVPTPPPPAPLPRRTASGRLLMSKFGTHSSPRLPSRDGAVAPTPTSG